MKKFWYLLSLPLGLLTFWCCGSFSNGKAVDQAAHQQAHRPLPRTVSVAVLELFTSQGCSSCPPADRLLGTYASKENIIPLCFHVDYWNRQGWKDPFSAKEYTERQYDYAAALHANVYTPQLVINGQSEMIGSDAAAIAAAIQKVMAGEPEAAIVIKKVQITAGTAAITFDLEGNTVHTALWLAWVENKATTPIKGGENTGITLDNYNIVRKLSTMGSFGPGDQTRQVIVPPATDIKNTTVVLFLQDKNSHKITAADRFVL